jgi:hypothetical protein
MAALNLNFHKPKGRHNPTKHEIAQIESIAVSVEAIVKALAEYARGSRDDAEDMGSVCLGVCNALELLIDPVIVYLSDYAGDAPAPEEAEETASGSE